VKFSSPSKSSFSGEGSSVDKQALDLCLPRLRAFPSWEPPRLAVFRNHL